MSDAVQDARTPLKRGAGANRIVLPAEGLSDDPVDLREDLERRFVLRRRGLHDIDGSPCDVPELNPSFCAEEVQESDECAVAGRCRPSDCRFSYLTRLYPPLLSDHRAQLGVKTPHSDVRQLRRLAVAELLNQIIAPRKVSLRECHLCETV
jgi:hypothetical protein